MMYWNGDMGVWGYVLMGVSFVLFWGAIITALILLARSLGPGNRRYEPGAGNAEHLLAERFARGDINETEYNTGLAVLRRGLRR